METLLHQTQKAMSVNPVAVRAAVILAVRLSAEKVFADAKDGGWRTTEEDHKIHIDESGHIDKGNPHVVKAINEHRKRDQKAKDDFDSESPAADGANRSVPKPKETPDTFQHNDGTIRHTVEAKKGDGSGISVHTDASDYVSGGGYADDQDYVKHSSGGGRQTRNDYTDNLKPDETEWGKYGSGKRTEHYDLPQGIYKEAGRKGGHILVGQNPDGELHKNYIDEDRADAMKDLMDKGVSFHSAKLASKKNLSPDQIAKVVEMHKADEPNHSEIHKYIKDAK